MQSETMEKRIYVLDTNILAINPNAIGMFKEHDVVIPIIVIQELDKLKKGKSGINVAARNAIKNIRKLRKETHLCNWTKINGANSGSFIVKKHERKIALDLQHLFGEDTPDHKILAVMKQLISEYSTKDKRTIILVTNDIDLFIKADSLGMNVQEFQSGRVEKSDESYKGFTLITRKIPTNRQIEISQKGYCKPSFIPKENLIPNHYFVYGSGESEQILRYNKNKNLLYLVKLPQKTKGKIYPKNLGQRCLWDALFDDNIRLITVKGEAGTGKSLLTIAAGLEKIFATSGPFKKVFYTKQLISLNDNDMGYFPGTPEEKIAPYVEPLEDCLDRIREEDSSGLIKIASKIEQAKNNKTLKAAPVALIRGTSKHGIFFLVDETQNLTPLEIKTIITRLGENCKVIFCGDVNQIDVPFLDSYNNGLSVLIEATMYETECVHITLTEGERGPLTNLANRIL